MAPGRLRLVEPGAAALGPCPDLAVARDHVAAALPGDVAHEARRRRVLAFLDGHPDALQRSCRAGHVTGSAMVVDVASRRFLLMLHAKLGRWLQPGGHADGDGALPGVALREAWEETGIAGLAVAVPAVDVDVHEVGAPSGRHLHLDVRYLVLSPPTAIARGNHESRALRWAAFGELAAYGVDRGLVRLAAASLAALDSLGG